MTELYDYMVDEELGPPATPSPDDLFNDSVYVRGACALHALRLELGDDVFFEFVQTYYAEYAYGNASTADFMTMAEEVSGEDLDDFFQMWLYDEDVPEME